METVHRNDSFSEGFRKWIRGYVQHVKEKTLHGYQEYGEVLSLFFGSYRLSEIDNNLIRAFQHWRSKAGNDDPEEPEQLKKSKFRHAASPTRIRNEINGCLKPILKFVGCWQRIKQNGFKHLPIAEEEGAGVELTREERRKLLEVAFSRKRWLLEAHFLRILYYTGSSPGEIFKLRRKDVDEEKRTILIVKGTKVAPRFRRTALTPTPFESMQWILERWRKLGCAHPDSYILPHRKHGFTKPMTSIYFAWRSIKKATAEKYPEMKGKLELLRIYDGRVTVASLLLDNGELSLPSIEKSLGWSPNSKMRKRYHRKELEDRRKVLATLEDESGVA